MSSIILSGTTEPVVTDEYEFIDHPKMKGLTIKGTRIVGGMRIPKGTFFSAPGPKWKEVHPSLFNMPVGEDARDIYVLPSPDYFLSSPTIIAPKEGSS